MFKVNVVIVCLVIFGLSIKCSPLTRLLFAKFSPFHALFRSLPCAREGYECGQGRGCCQGLQCKKSDDKFTCQLNYDYTPRERPQSNICSYPPCQKPCISSRYPCPPDSILYPPSSPDRHFPPGGVFPPEEPFSPRGPFPPGPFPAGGYFPSDGTFPPDGHFPSDGTFRPGGHFPLSTRPYTPGTRLFPPGGPYLPEEDLPIPMEDPIPLEGVGDDRDMWSKYNI